MTDRGAGRGADRGNDHGSGRGAGRDRPAVQQRSWLEIQWRRTRNAPYPVVRAVASDLAVALVLGGAYLAYDVALTRGARLPGGDLRTLAVLVFVAVVVVAGTWITYLVVPQPTGSGGRRRRTGWSAGLGFFASVPIAYLVLVLVAQVIKPLLV